MKKQIILLMCVLALLSTMVSASVGLGVSPSRTEHRIEGGKTFEATYTVYNTGTNDVVARFSADGDLKPFVSFAQEGIHVPKHSDPDRSSPANGQVFTVTYAPPPTRKPYTLTGYVVASGGPAPGATFGGNVAVAMRVSILVEPTKHFWNYITKQQWIVGSSILGLFILILLGLMIARRKGVHFKMEVSKPRKT